MKILHLCPRPLLLIKKSYATPMIIVFYLFAGTNGAVLRRHVTHQISILIEYRKLSITCVNYECNCFYESFNYECNLFTHWCCLTKNNSAGNLLSLLAFVDFVVQVFDYWKRKRDLTFELLIYYVEIEIKIEWILRLKIKHNPKIVNNIWFKLNVKNWRIK